MDKFIERIAKAPALVKIGAIAAICIAITALNYFLFISSIEDRIVAQESQQRTLDIQLTDKKKIAQNLNDYRRDMDVLQQQLAEALTKMPTHKNIDELLAQMNDVAKKSGLEIARVEPGNEVPANFFAKIPIKMTVSGNYHEIAMFLQEVAGMRRIVNVNNIKLSTATTKNEKVILSSDFLATTFRFLDQTPKQGDNKGGTPK